MMQQFLYEQKQKVIGQRNKNKVKIKRIKLYFTLKLSIVLPIIYRE